MKLGLVREDFSLHAENTFATLFEDNELTDVTLVCKDGGEEVKAHKIILSCGSGFFKDLFRQKQTNKCTNKKQINKQKKT